MCILLLLSGDSCNNENEKLSDHVSLEINKVEPLSPDKHSIYDYDTILIREYISDNKNIIRLEGSQIPSFIYRIKNTTLTGNSRSFQVAENSYMANHSSVKWDNDDFIFVHTGCGSPCWYAQVLPLKTNDKIKIYQFYIFQDSITNTIVYPKYDNFSAFIFENFKTGRYKEIHLNICMKCVRPIDAIIDVKSMEKGIIQIIYIGEDCEDEIRQVVDVRQLGE